MEAFKTICKIFRKTNLASDTGNNMSKRYQFYNSIQLLIWVSMPWFSAFGQIAPADPTYTPPPLQVEFVPQSGFYSDSIDVQLLSPGAKIYCTTDGTEPRAISAHRFSTPIRITKTTVLRAIAVMKGEQSHSFSATYFIDEPESTFPVMSVSITPGLLFNPVWGLFQRGENAIDTLWYLPGANFWSHREFVSNFEFFETNGESVWANEAGLRLFGGMSRLSKQKSISITARNQYGDKRIRHRVFGKKGLKKYKSLVLRNSGSDFGKSHFRDALMTHLVKDWDLDIQDYRPSQVYINGEYWGIYNLREKINPFFVEAHHDVDRDSIDMIEHKITRRAGRTSNYRELLAFLENNNLANPANYAYVQSLMEVNNYMDHQIAQIYFDNQDAGGNIRFWRPRTEKGRWRWILYDTDWGFGLNDRMAYRNNSLDFHTEVDGPRWPNPPWSTFILRKLLENEDFKQEFVKRFCDYLNDDLEATHVLNTIDKFYKRLLPEIQRHLDRWKLDRQDWEREVETIREFANARPDFIRGFLQEKFDLGDERKVDIEIALGGKVVINNRLKARDHFEGEYFEKTPIRLLAKPDLGYRFVRWEGDRINSESPELLLELNRPVLNLKCVFERFEHPLAGKVIINEVSCNNNQSEDWIEIFNTTKDRVNLHGWVLTDRKNEFVFPKYILPPKGYVVLCEDSVKFLNSHPRVQSLIGGLNFGLDKRHEVIQLFSPETAAVDSIAYELEPMDSVFSFDLLLPTLDNGDQSNWEIVMGNGSPAAANQYYLVSSIQARRETWIQIGMALGVIFLCLALLVLRRRGVL